MAAIPAAAASQPQPDRRLGFFARWPDITGAGVDVSDQPVPVGAKMSYSSATSSHEGIDMLAEHGILYAGERERLHRVLDGNLSRGA
jgi:hypothetical protein